MASHLLNASRLILGLAGLAVIALTAFAATGVRGSDQFWYVADVESIAGGDGAFTNSVFPRTLLVEEAEPPYRPIHHHPLLYILAPLARVVGGYAAWLLLNVGCVLAAALLVRSLLRDAVGEPLANLSAALFAVLPAAFWQATQPLADAWIAFLVMLSCWSICRSEGAAGRWPVAFASLLLAALCREFLALPLLLLPILYLLWSEAPRRRKAIWAAAMVLVSALAVLAKGQLFPQQIAFSPAAAWRQLADDGPSMYLYFDLGRGPLAVAELLRGAAARLGRALLEHLLPPWRQSVFYLPFNALVIVALSGWWARRKRAAPPRLLVLCSALLALHLMVIATQHASYRYTLAITAPLLVAAVTVLGERLRPVGALRIWLWAAVLAGAVTIDGALAAKSRQEGRAIARLTADSREILEPLLGPGGTVMFEAAAPAPGVWYLWAGHALPSSTLLYLAPEYPYEAATYDRLRLRSGASWLICRRGSPLREALKAAPEPVAQLPEPARNWGVYRLPRDSVLAAPSR